MVVHEKLRRKLIEPTFLSRSYNPCNYYECTSRDSLGPAACLFFKIYRGISQALSDALKELGVDDNTLLVFASDNGPSGEIVRAVGNHGTPDMGNAGPFRGELGEVTEGSIRTFAFAHWPGKVAPGSTSNAMFSIMDWFPLPV